MKEAMKQIIAEIDALPEGLEGYFSDAFADNLAKVREALAQPEQEPVAWAMDYDIESVLSGFSTSLMGTAMRIESAFPKHRVKLLYTTPPQRTEQEPVATLEDLEQEIYQNTRNFVSRDVMEWMLKRYYTHPTTAHMGRADG